MQYRFLVVSLLVVSFFNHAQPPYLFTKFPALKDAIPHIELCDLPTPIEKMEGLGNKLGTSNLYVKRDDLSGNNIGDGFRLYGGNKPRKSEFSLADALAKKAKTIITYGCAGSNHALATAVYAHKLGLKTILMLKNQPNSYVVRHNLLLDQHYKAELQFFPDNKTRNKAAQELLESDKDAYLIPTGGSNAIGVLGFVNAGLELADQIEKNQIKEPDVIYVATGSCATTAGLLLGLCAANIQSKVVAVCVEPQEETDEYLKGIKRLFDQANLMLNMLDNSFPLYEFPVDKLELNKKYCGIQYGLFIPEVVGAINSMKDSEGIKLEGTYSAKPIVAIMDDYAAGALTNETVLFWNTYCGIDYSFLTKHSDYKKLPKEFHKYFEEDVQELASKC